MSALPSLNAALQLKSEVFYSPPFNTSPGEVTFKYFYNVDFPKGHLALKSFRADVVNAQGHVIPYNQIYLHHSSMSRYHQSNNDGFISRRNHGVCQGDILGQYVGIGTETRGSPIHVPDPYGIEIGDPDLVPDGFEEKWMLAVHTIDTRGAVDRVGCTECRKDLYNVTVDQFGVAFGSDYHGGLAVCYAGSKCRVRDGYDGATWSLRMRYEVTWMEWVAAAVVPVRLYIFDVCDDMKLRVDPSDGTVRAEHDCKVEYYVERCNKENEEKCVDIKRSTIAMPKGGNLIYAQSHLHSGSINSTLYGQDGRVLCTTEPVYGEGEEQGYVVGMSACYPDPGSVFINDGELLVHESVYAADRRRTGVMALFHLFIADPLPDNTSASSFLRLPSSMVVGKFDEGESKPAVTLQGGGGDVTIGEALEAAVLTAGKKPVERSDAAAIQAAEVRATRRTTIVPGGIAAAAQSAATHNARATSDEEKTTLADVLSDAKAKLPADRVATRKDAEGVAGAEMRNDPYLTTHPTGVAASVAAAARINQQANMRGGNDDNSNN
ncbi:Late embryogenesis abundant protein 47 [Linum perenne]